MPLLFGRREMPPVSAGTVAVAGKSISFAPSMRRTYDELRRSADWGRLSAQARGQALANIAQSAAPREVVASGLFDFHTDTAFQAWYTQLAATVLHPEAIASIQSWLRDAPANGHLFVAGPPNRGRLGVILTLARQAMAQVPAAPDYCLVPNPDAIERQMLLMLPGGKGSLFADACATAWNAIGLQYWTKDNVKQAGEQTSPGLFAAPFEAVFGWLREVAPSEAFPYVVALRQTLRSLIDLPIRPTISQAMLLTPLPDLGAHGVTNAPVTVATQATTHSVADALALLLRARGGILILPAEIVPSLWDVISPVLRTGLVTVNGVGLELPLRVIIIGTQGQYLGLSDKIPLLDLFRYKAVFEGEVTWDAWSEAAYAAQAREIAARAGVPPLDAGGVAYLIEEGARRVDSRNRAKLTTNLAMIQDLVIDAGKQGASSMNTTAGAQGQPAASRADIEAVVSRRRRQLSWDRRNRLVARLSGYLNVLTDGDEIGAITGVGVSDELEEEIAASLIRHTVTVSHGNEERLVDVEREADAADQSHRYGALTMIGYLAWQYGREHPISLIARVRGEERGKANGPSASAAELFALLSALSGVPIYRSWAVTGVAGQHGDIQTIGGVNYKIEGFWELCNARWETGERPPTGFGMLIPWANAEDLMIRPEIAERIEKDGWFTVWPIRTIDDGLPLLTGVAADVIHEKVRRQLATFHRLACQRH